MKALPKIQKYMTTMPHTVGEDISLNKALELMREYHVRHLPVQNAGKLVGVLTDRDIKLATSFRTPSELTVGDVMTPDPYVVDPDIHADTVAYEMAEHKYGCAIIAQKNGKIVGIFTAVDGLRVLGDLLRENYKE